jgi:nucleoprotein TPR
MQKLRASSSTSDSEVERLKSRIASLESSNRDTLSLLESKSTAHSEVSNELVAKQQKINELRGEISRLEQAAQTANSSAVAAKLREQNLKQEVEALRRNNDWLDSELKTKSTEFANFRKEKNARLAELQQENEDRASTIDSLQRSESSLRARVEEMTTKADKFLVQIKDLREEADRNEENLRAELDTAKRLEKLMEESMHTAKERQHDLTEQLEQAKDDAAEEVGRISAEAETEHQERIAAERRVAELEAQLEQHGANVEEHSGSAGDVQSPGKRSARDATPLRGNLNSTPSKLGGQNFTQLVTDYHSTRTELEKEKRRNEELRTAVDDMLKDIERRQPEILEMQADHERMENDLVEMSTYAEKMAKERDDAKKATRKVEREIHGLARENELVRQQLRDLSSQIKVLLMELNAQSEGLDPFTAEQRAQLEQLARGDFQADLSQEVTDTSRFISEHLTAFRNVAELIDQNSKLLRVAREVGERMEGEEAQAEKTQAAQNLRELEELRQKYQSSKDEIAALVTQSQSYIKERDMFRRMLSQRGQLQPNHDAASNFGDSVRGQSPATPLPHDKFQQSPNSKDIEDYRKLLKEMQSHFDTYRQEAAADRTGLKDQLETASRKNHELRNELSRKSGEVTLASERYEMLQGNLNMMKAENAEMQKRMQSSSERATAQEIRAQQVVEELVESRGIVESMRNENANLKAEKEFWKSVESRLTKDNESLLADRDRLNALNTSLQTMLNEREHSETETRRRYQNQLENLENETQTLKRRLSEEQEERKRLVMRREYDTSQTQSRVDELSANLASTREELVAAKTTRDHLQARVDELTIEFRSAEEKLNVLQSKPADSNSQETDVPNGADNEEQALKLKMAELKKDYELAQSELAAARLQVEQYKAISQGSEDELRSFNETHEQYRQETDNSIAAKDARVKELEQNITTLREELSARDTELNEVRLQLAQHDAKVDEQKHALDAEIAALKDSCERAEAAARYHQEDLRTQANIAQQAQQNYENELLKHAEAAKTAQKFRNEHNNLRVELAGVKSSAEAAQTKLKQNEESWLEAKQRYENELSELRTRRDDMNGQNTLLHEQLENVYRQVSELQKRRTSDGNSDEIPETTPSNNDSDNLQELIRYLRREKEIVDVQHDLATQEARRLRQQLEQTQSQLEDTRLKLGQQRRAEEHNERNALNHKKLLDTIEELNLNRESNSTLRMEKAQLQSSLNEKLKQIEDLQSRIGPLQAKITELEEKNDTVEQQLRLAQEARTRFEQRYTDILNRSNSIDPAEYEKVTQQVAALELERNTLLASQTELKAQVDGIPDQIKARIEEANQGFQERRQHLMEQSKSRDRAQTAKLKDANQAKTALEGQVKELEANLEQARKEHQEALNQARKEHQESLEQAKAQAQTEIEAPSGAATANGVSDRSPGAESAAEISRLQEQLVAANTKISKYEAELVSTDFHMAAPQPNPIQAKLRADFKQLNAEVSELKSTKADIASQASAQVAGDQAQELETLRQELSQARQDAEEQRAALLVKESAANVREEEGSPTIEEQIRSQVVEIRAELTKRHDERLRQLEENYKARADGMRSQLSKKLVEGKVDITQKLESSHKAALAKLEEDHERNIQQLNDRHARELSELRTITNNSSSTPRNVATSAAQTGDIHDQLTEAEIRAVLQKNEIARKFVASSLTNRENKAREEQQKLWTQKMADAEVKAKQALDQAVNMEGKRSGVKLNMAENRLRVANAKLDVVKQAATDTPEKPVSDIWTIAEKAKPAPAAQAAGTQQSIHASLAAPSPKPAAASATTGGKPTRQAWGTNANQAASETPTVQAQTSANAQQEIPPSSDSPQQALKAGMSASAHATPPKAAAPKQATSNTGQGTKTDNMPKGLDQPLSDPKPNSAGRDQGQQAPATRSAIPQPTGGRGGAAQQPAQRGGPAAARGRGRGGTGRGGLATVNTSQAADSVSSTSNSPRGMSATAKQFVPRKRDAAGAGLESSVHAAENKRAKPEGGQGA